MDHFLWGEYDKINEAGDAVGASNRGDLMAFGIDDNDDGFGFEETRINYTENS